MTQSKDASHYHLYSEDKQLVICVNSLREAFIQIEAFLTKKENNYSKYN